MNANGLLQNIINLIRHNIVGVMIMEITTKDENECKCQVAIWGKRFVITVAKFSENNLEKAIDAEFEPL